MVCTDFHTGKPTLTRFTESRLETHDVEIPITHCVQPRTVNASVKRALRVMVLSSSSVREAKLEDTLQRMRHFASLTGGQDLAIVFLLNPPGDSTFMSAMDFAKSSHTGDSNTDGILAYSKLQAEIINHNEIPHVPILPLATIEGLTQVLAKHTTELSRPIRTSKALTTPFELLRLCTTCSPMPQKTAFILSDLFINLKDFAAACSSASSSRNSCSRSTRVADLAFYHSSSFDLPGGTDVQGPSSDSLIRLKQLRDLIGDRAFRDVIDFWVEEWTLC